jgi:hypothetical protein
VVSDFVFLDELEEICGRKTSESGFCEMRIGGEKVVRACMNVREIAAAPAGDQDFLADAIGVFDDRDAAAPFTCFGGAEKTSGTRTENEDVKMARQVGLA